MTCEAPVTPASTASHSARASQWCRCDHVATRASGPVVSFTPQRFGVRYRVDRHAGVGTWRATGVVPEAWGLPPWLIEPAWRDHRGFVRQHDELRAVTHVELGHDAADVRLRRRGGEHQALGD